MQDAPDPQRTCTRMLSRCFGDGDAKPGGWVSSASEDPRDWTWGAPPFLAPLAGGSFLSFPHCPFFLPFPFSSSAFFTSSVIFSLRRFSFASSSFLFFSSSATFFAAASVFFLSSAAIMSTTCFLNLSASSFAFFSSASFFCFSSSHFFFPFEFSPPPPPPALSPPLLSLLPLLSPPLPPPFCLLSTGALLSCLAGAGVDAAGAGAGEGGAGAGGAGTCFHDVREWEWQGDVARWSASRSGSSVLAKVESALAGERVTHLGPQVWSEKIDEGESE